MPQIYYSTIISAPLEKVWEMVRDFSSFPSGTPTCLPLKSRIPRTGVHGLHRLRPAHSAREGGMDEGKLLALSDADFTLTYSIVETKMKVANFMGAITLTPSLRRTTPSPSGRPSSTWQREAQEEETADAVLAHFSAGLENLDEIFLGEYDRELSRRCNTEDKCTCGEDEDGGEKPRAEG
ncbi:hypothetical protein MASR2M79_13840 [Aminivibrio sp.]